MRSVNQCRRSRMRFESQMTFRLSLQLRLALLVMRRGSTQRNIRLSTPAPSENADQQHDNVAQARFSVTAVARIAEGSD